MPTVVWDEENTVKLIKEYEKQDVLWNTENRGYLHRNARNDAWTAIASALNYEVRQIKRKMNSLIAVFRSQHRQGVANPRWWAGHMAFLLNIGNSELEKQDTSSQSYVFSEDTGSTINEEQQGSDCEFIESKDSKKRPFKSAFQEFCAAIGNEIPAKSAKIDLSAVSCVNMESIPTTETTTVFNISDDVIKETMAETAEKSLDEPNYVVPSSSTNTMDEDLALYMKYIACKLAKYSPRTRTLVQYKFNQILYETDMGILESDDLSGSKKKP